MNRIVFRVFILILMLSSCKASKMKKRAFELEQSGSFDEAANYYYKSLLSNDKDVEAILGLKKSSQIILDQKRQDFQKAYSVKDYKSATYLYLDALSIVERAEEFGISLLRHSDSEIYFREAKEGYLGNRYSAGMRELTAGNYSGAKLVFEEIVNIDSQFRDSEKQLEVAVKEPKYLKGISYLDANQPRKAFYAFEEIRLYKQSSQYMKEAKEKARFVIGLVSSTGWTSQGKSKAKDYIYSHMSHIDSPFLEFVDIDERTLAQSNNTERLPKGLKAIMRVDVDQYETNTGKKEQRRKKAYHKVATKSKNEAGEEVTKYDYRKVWYDEYYQKSTCHISLQYKLISIFDGVILASGYLTDSVEDEVEYSIYDGGAKNLVPGQWESKNEASPIDKVDLSSGSISKLRSQFDNRMKLKGSEELANNLLSEFSSKINLAILNYDPED
ncbi:hypothetical protein [Aureibacter tunicatorum]|uniref:Tetratricopeptide (TPR) repeat protein n=1 Tax=Aureibacter tunicatorum TaxID=866807 RepID=A0AAE3XIU2_9BACT|nr:hypothetical protein [Aureibacter tunicatorum]MDR6237632.1 tetratricopeptide (TPR) repeat protein [Aureibacter tunicatorum]BDD02667.1 hypothetical protein AUTU_01500 [Aureibacter tunicatorum]